MDDIEYSIEIFRWNRTSKVWQPYIAQDFMLDFVMLDPYVRIPLKKDIGLPTFRAQFKIPDKYGVF